jgi:hypothetical protein
MNLKILIKKKVQQLGATFTYSSEFLEIEEIDRG